MQNNVFPDQNMNMPPNQNYPNCSRQMPSNVFPDQNMPPNYAQNQQFCERNMGIIGDASDQNSQMKKIAANKAYHAELLKQMEEKEEKKQAAKLADRQLGRDTLDQQMMMQQRMDNEKKLMEQDRKSYMNDYLKNQMVEKNTREGKTDLTGNRFYAEAAPPPNNVDIRRHMPSQEERYSMQTGAKDILKQGGNLNRAVVRSELTADQAYQEIKRKNGNTGGNYNILTGH